MSLGMLVGCTGASSPQASPPTGDEATPSRTGDVAAPPLVGDNGGEVCVGTVGANDDLMYGTGMIRSSAAVETRGLELVGASGVEAVRSWVVPAQEDAIPGTYLAEPGEGDVAREFRWAERMPVSKAVLDERGRYVVVARLQRPSSSGPGGFRAIRMDYTSDGEEFSLTLDAVLRYKSRCG